MIPYINVLKSDSEQINNVRSSFVFPMICCEPLIIGFKTDYCGISCIGRHNNVATNNYIFRHRSQVGGFASPSQAKGEPAYLSNLKRSNSEKPKGGSPGTMRNNYLHFFIGYMFLTAFFFSLVLIPNSFRVIPLASLHGQTKVAFFQPIRAF